MKKILIVTGEFVPYFSANTNCLLNLIAGLKANDYSVTVMCYAYDETIPKEEEKCGCSIRRVMVTENDRLDKFYNAMEKKPFPISLIGMRLAVNGFKYVWFMKRRRAVRFYKKYLKQENYDYILSDLFPPDGHIIASRIADQNTKWIMYNLDPYIGDTTHGLMFIGKWLTERKWCRKASGVINLRGIRQSHERRRYAPYKNLPVLETHLPNLVIPPELPAFVKKPEGEKLVLRYAGAFYEHIRRPDALIRLLEKLDPQQFTAEFYGVGCDYLKKNFPKLPPCVQLKGAVNAETCRSLMQTADILVNVGNMTIDQFPSKTFEYIATGKPILNLYSVPDDPALPFLRRYPCALHVSETDEVGQSDVLRLYREAPSVSAEQLRELYSDVLRESITKSMIDFIESL